jgi:hypothetical protein
MEKGWLILEEYDQILHESTEEALDMIEEHINGRELELIGIGKAYKTKGGAFFLLPVIRLTKSEEEERIAKAFKKIPQSRFSRAA